MTSTNTGIAYDERMCLHQTQDHPESPDRIKAIFNKLKKNGLLNKCKLIDCRESTPNEILSVHSKDHLLKMHNVSKLKKDSEFDHAASLYNSIYFNKWSYQCALLSAGSVIELCDQVVTGALQNGIAIVRPPGHHAEKK